MNKKIIAVVGMAGAGKSTVVDLLVNEYSLPYIYFGNITLSEVKKRGLEVCQENEKNIRVELRQIHGMAAYAKLSLPQIEDHLRNYDKVLIDGLYSWSEYVLLHKETTTTVILVCVIAKRNTRYRRLLERKERPLSFEESEKRDFAEIEGIEKGGPIALCDYYITNDGTEDALKKQIVELMKELGCS